MRSQIISSGTVLLLVIPLTGTPSTEQRDAIENAAYEATKTQGLLQPAPTTETAKPIEPAPTTLAAGATREAPATTSSEAPATPPTPAPTTLAPKPATAKPLLTAKIAEHADQREDTPRRGWIPDSTEDFQALLWATVQKNILTFEDDEIRAIFRTARWALTKLIPDYQSVMELPRDQKRLDEFRREINLFVFEGFDALYGYGPEKQRPLTEEQAKVLKGKVSKWRTWTLDTKLTRWDDQWNAPGLETLQVKKVEATSKQPEPQQTAPSAKTPQRQSQVLASAKPQGKKTFGPERRHHHNKHSDHRAKERSAPYGISNRDRGPTQAVAAE